MAFAAMMSALALLGTVEFALGRVGPGIFIAVLGELAFAGLFLSALRK